MSTTTIQGPPGTGKTTHLSQLVDTFVQYGVDPKQIAIFSLTKTAAHAASEKIDLPEENIGTIHKAARRACRGKEPVDSWQGIRKFNYWLGKRGKWDLQLEPGFEDDEELSERDKNDHNRVMQDYMKLRAQLNFDAVNELKKEHEIIRLWEKYKAEKHLSDFEDWIYNAASCSSFAGLPYAISHLLIDEAQDCSPSEKRLIEAWSGGLEQLCIVGDPMQALYRFRGAEPMQFFSTDDIVLKQSYRLPGNPCDYAKLLAKYCPEYVPQEYRAKVQSRQGVVERLTIDGIIEIAEYAIKNKLDAMFLATTSYGCDVYRNVFMDYGIPFKNEYRPRSKRWNPMQTDAAALFKILLKLQPDSKRRFWTVAQMKRILTPLQSVHCLPGTIETMEKLCSTPKQVAEFLVYNSFVSTEFKQLVQDAATGNLDFIDDYIDMMDFKFKGAARWLNYFVNVYRMEGPGPFTPAMDGCVTVGTCHSVKGGEADIVVLSDAVTRSQFNAEYAEYADLVRTFYVGATRTRDRLYLLDSGEDLHFAALWSALNDYSEARKSTTD